MVPVTLPALLIGAVAGLRTFTAPTAVSWAAWAGWFDLTGTPLAVLGTGWTPWFLTLLAGAELIVDLHPATPSRKTRGPFAARLISGSVSGAAIGASAGAMVGGLLAGAVGAVAGTLVGYRCRMGLAGACRADRPAALIEDAVAIVSAWLILAAAR